MLECEWCDDGKPVVAHVSLILACGHGSGNLGFPHQSPICADCLAEVPFNATVETARCPIDGRTDVRAMARQYLDEGDR